MSLDRLGVRGTLILLALVPLVALAAISVFVVDRANDDATAAQQRAEAIDQAVTLGQVRSTVLLEAILYDLWAIESVSAYSIAEGATGEALVAQVRTATDDSIAGAADLDLDPTTTASFDTLTDELSTLRDRWDATDRSIGQEAGALVDRAAAFESASSRALLVADGGDALSIVLFEDFATTISLESSLASRILIEGVRSTQDVDAHAAASAKTDVELDLLVESIGGDGGAAFRAMVDDSSFMEMRTLVRALPVDGEPAPIDPLISALLLAQGTADSDAMYELGLVQVDAAKAQADTAYDEARRTRLIVIIASLLGVGLTVLSSRIVGGRLSRRIERVASAATAISGGELDVSPIDDQGEDELAALAGTFDEMSATLSAVQRQLGALADERYDDPLLGTELPGTIGRNLRMAIRRVNNTTAMLRTRADTDPLTGLFNRSALEERATERPDTAVVAVIDLDGFKAINDTLGHAAGDEVLIKVARLLEQSTRDGDLVGRLGGDEFAIVAWDDLEVVRAMAERLVDTISATPGTAGVGCSIGVVAAEPGEPFERLIQRADAAMYEAKRGGKGFVVAA